MRPVRAFALTILLLPLSPLWAAKILFVFPFDMRSQCMLLTPYLQVLLDRGHQLTVIHSIPNCEIVQKLHSIYIEDRFNSALEFNSNDFLDGYAHWTGIYSIRNYMVKSCLNVLENKEVKQLMESNTSYDLVVIEPSNTDGLFGLAAHFNATLIGLATCGGDWNLDNLVGFTSSSMEPLIPIGVRRGISLLDRFHNWILISEEWLIHKLIFLPALRGVHDHYFGHLNHSFVESRQSFSLILLNQHFSLFESRPNVPSFVEVGGMHVPKELPQLPQDLLHFIEDAPQGVIYMSLGTDVQSKDLPASTLKILLNTFAALPQRIIWKVEGYSVVNITNNIYMSDWLPQQAILAQPNVRLFITHGGILSIIEAAYYAKPVLGFPVFFDQFRNMERMQVEGVAQVMDILNLKKQDFESTLKDLLEDPKYHRNALILSQRFRDQPLHPLDSAVYWTEYILKYKGAPYMRVPLTNMKLMDYYSFDNVLLIVGRLGVLIFLVIYVLRKLLQFRLRTYSRPWH